MRLEAYLYDEINEYDEFIDFVNNHDIRAIDEGILDTLTGALKKKILFIKGLASQLKFDIGELVKLFKDTRVFKFFAKVGWSLKKLYDLLKKGLKVAHNVADVISEYIAKTGVAKWTTEKLNDLDKFLATHPKTRRLAGIAVAALLVYIWFNMTLEWMTSWPLWQATCQ